MKNEQKLIDILNNRNKNSVNKTVRTIKIDGYHKNIDEFIDSINDCDRNIITIDTSDKKDYTDLKVFKKKEYVKPQTKVIEKKLIDKLNENHSEKSKEKQKEIELETMVMNNNQNVYFKIEFPKRFDHFYIYPSSNKISNIVWDFLNDTISFVYTPENLNDIFYNMFLSSNTDLHFDKLKILIVDANTNEILWEFHKKFFKKNVILKNFDSRTISVSINLKLENC